MSNRRLAAEAVQPASFAFSAENQSWAERKMKEYPPGRQQSAVIPLLWRAQEQEGWVSRAVIEGVAKMLGMAYIRVLEVATFYTMFLLQPVGTRAHIQVCGTTPCMLRGAEDLRAVCQSKINHEPFETNPDGTMSWEEVECLGACVNAPMVMIGKDTYEDLSVERFEEIVDAFAAGKGNTVKPGTQIDRIFSAPEGGPVTLLARSGTAKPATKPRAAAAPAAPQEPTTPGRKREIPDESAPALKSPSEAKVSTAAAEAARTEASAHAASGEPAKAMRPKATGAESPAGKIDGGKAAGKPTRAPAGDGAGAAGTAPQPPAAAAPAAAASELKPTAEAGGTTPLFSAPSGASDDLKLISGVGPALEKRMNELGITTWKQVAALTPEQIDQVEGRLRFRGRIARDRWLDQAKALSDGGVEEYKRVFGKDPR